MRILLPGLLMLALPVWAWSAEPGQELKIGMLNGMFRDVQPSMVQALAKPFRDLMSRQVGFTGDVELFDDPLALTKAMKDNKLKLAVFHGFEFAWAKGACDDLLPLVITQPPGGKVQAMLVMQRDAKARTIADLADTEVIIPRGAKAHTLAFLARERTGLADTVAKPTAQVKQTMEDVLMAVATGETQAALVDVGAMEGFRILHPGAYKSLKVLAESEEFPPAVVAYRKGTLSEDEITKIRRGLSTASKTASGKMLMTLWNLKGFETPTDEYDKSVSKILKAYPAPTDAKNRSGTLTGQKKSGN